MPHKTLIVVFLLFLPLASFSQPCHDYPCVVQKVKKALRAKDYTDTFLQLEAAAAYPNSKPEEVKALRQQLFDSINREKRQAIEARKQVEKEKQKAQQALANLQQSNARVVKLLLENAGQDVLELQYEDALEKIKAAAELSALQEEVAAAELEIAFWHNEAGHTQRAVGILDSAASLVDKEELAASLHPLPKDSLAAREQIRAALQQFDPATYQMFWERYYPILVEVPGGTFTMGCNSEVDSDCGENETQHPATVSDFQMTKYETTWWQYYLFCQSTGHEYASPGWGTDGDNPAVNINWYDAVAYANWVSRQLGVEEAITEEEGAYQLNLHSSGYRLPTEAEWEYAARGGAQVRMDAAKGDRVEQLYIYSGSNTMDSVGWHRGNSDTGDGVTRTRAVGQLKANALSLHDMSGNVWEWCWDWYESYPENPAPDYAGPPGGSSRVIRGGTWFDYVSHCRLSNRNVNYPVQRHDDNGFRLSRSRWNVPSGNSTH